MVWSLCFQNHNGKRITKIIIDPYEPGGFNGALTYGQIGDIADIIVTSHDHADHNFVRGIPGDYTLIDKAGEYPLSDGEKIETIPVYHDDSKGSERGNNLITVISSESLVLAHLGDLGHRLDPGIISKIGKLDILLLPVGGFFTIDAVTAIEVKNVLGPSVTIPMHYRRKNAGSRLHLSMHSLGVKGTSAFWMHARRNSKG